MRALSLSIEHGLIICKLSHSIQPPGLFHQVYTPENAITVGGHFVLEDALHLTAWSRLCTHRLRGDGTNAYHDSMVRVFSRIAIAKAFGGQVTSKLSWQHWRVGLH